MTRTPRRGSASGTPKRFVRHITHSVTFRIRSIEKEFFKDFGIVHRGKHRHEVEQASSLHRGTEDEVLRGLRNVMCVAPLRHVSGQVHGLIESQRIERVSENFKRAMHHATPVTFWNRPMPDTESSERL